MASITTLPPINNTPTKNLNKPSVNHQKASALHVASSQKKGEVEVCSYPEMTALVKQFVITNNQEKLERENQLLKKENQLLKGRLEILQNFLESLYANNAETVSILSGVITKS